MNFLLKWNSLKNTNYILKNLCLEANFGRGEITDNLILKIPFFDNKKKLAGYA